MHQLAAHGASGLDRPVAAYWPGFGQHGKDEITVRPVLQHRSGLPVSRGAGVWGPWVTADHHQLVRSVRGIERARPRRPPGGGALAEATRPSGSGEPDQFLKLRIRWSQGFQLGGPVPGRATSHPVGDSSARETFGRGGSNAWVAWADPTRGLAVAYLTALLPAGLDRARHPSKVSDAILAAHP